MLITPKATVTPQRSRNVATRSPTVVNGSGMMRLSPRDASEARRVLAGRERDAILETVLHQAIVRLRRDTAGSSGGAGMGAPIIAEIEAAAAQVSAVILP